MTAPATAADLWPHCQHCRDHGPCDEELANQLHDKACELCTTVPIAKAGQGGRIRNDQQATVLGLVLGDLRGRLDAERVTQLRDRQGSGSDTLVVDFNGRLVLVTVRST